MFNFPNTPTVGDMFEAYSWDGEKWILTVGGIAGPPPPPVGPPGVTGLIGWWDMKVPGSITQAAGKVINLADQSGGGNHLGDGSTTQKPLYNATGLNSQPAMTFDGPPGLGGTSQFIAATSAFPMGVGNTLTFFAVAKVTSSVSTNGRLLSYIGSGASSDEDNASSWTTYSDNSYFRMRLIRNSVGTSGSSLMDANTPRRLIGTINSSGVMTCYIDNVAIGTVTSSGNWTNNGSLRVGNYSTAYWGGAISEIGIATGFSDTAAVALLDAYLKTKWGL